MSESITIIGGGNMGAALLGGLLSAGHPTERARVAEPDAARAAALSRRLGVTVSADTQAMVSGADLVVLAVKPQALREAVRGLQLHAGTTVLSVAAGVRVDSLRRWMGADLHYVRAMPNTPALIRAGISGAFTPLSTPAASRDSVDQVLSSVGEVCWVQDEALLDAVTALSGSGPAYVFLLVEALRDAGLALGLPAETAAELAVVTLVGGARLVRESGEDAATLRARVTSPGGTTEAALAVLEQAGLRGHFRMALAAAAQRARELGEALDKTP
jgi:pyrroline-5-carboxylate reductase